MNQHSHDEHSLTHRAISPVSVYDENFLGEKSKNPIKMEMILEEGLYTRTPMFFCDYAHIDKSDENSIINYINATSQNFKKTLRCTFSDALVAGQGSVVIDDEFLVRESCIEFLAQGIAPDGFVRKNDLFFLTDTVTRKINAPTLLLERPWHQNYGHWLVDSAAMASLMSRIAMPDNWIVVVGEQSHPVMKKMIHESLQILLPNVKIVEKPKNETWQFRELHYITPIHVPPLYKNPEAISTLRSSLSRPHLYRPSRFRRVFVKRGANTTRTLQNENHVIDILSDRGFDIVDYQERTLDEQCALFRECEIVVGVKGATLTNCMFCTNNSHLLALSPADFPDPFFWDLVSHSGMKYSEIFGNLVSAHQPKSHNAFTIDIDTLSSAINKIEQDIIISHTMYNHF